MDQFLDPETDANRQFLDPETDKKFQFLDKNLLDPETDVMEQFLGPETDIKHQFLDPETDIKRQFLVDHPETDIMDQFLDPETDIMGERTYISKKNPVYLKTLSKLRLTSLPPTLFLTNLFWQSVDHVDLPPSPRIFDKNREILGFETYNLYYPYYFLRVRGTDRKTQSPFKWIFYWRHPSNTFMGQIE